MNFSVLEQEIDPLDLTCFLASQDLFPKFYWKCRKKKMETACLGALLEWSEIPKAISDKLYGVVAFPNSLKTPLWEDFSSPYFFLPQLEIKQTSSKTLLKIRGSFPSLHPPFENLSSAPSIDVASHLPSLDLWERSIQKILTSQIVEKVVLARQSSFRTSDHPYSWLKKLLTSSHNSTVFAFQKKRSSLFLGATPEMLYERMGRELKTESLAGTSKKKDSSFDLQSSVKDKKEFSYVKSFLSETLSFLCEEFSSDPIDSLLETSHLKHLYSRFQGLLKEGVTDADLLSALHPTPAVGALPRKEGLSQIASLEPFDRGLYAGALGWISPKESSFAVTIRSALIKEGFLHAFAGTGIVEGSAPQQEWDELDAKLSHWKSSCPTHL